METRIIPVEVRTDHIEKSIDRIERSIYDLRNDVDKKFHWVIGVQITTLLAIIGLLCKGTIQF